MNGYIMTVDTGGSKTQITLFNSEGVKLYDARCAGIGASNESEKSLFQLEQTLEGLIDKEKASDIHTIVINVGGKNTNQIKSEFLQLFPTAHIEVYRESSGVIMSALCDAENADAILMAGTGTIALAKGVKGNIIVDGWCPNVGDFGSGYWIGLEAISRSVKALEESAELTPLIKHTTGRSKPFTALADTTEQMLLRDEVRTNFMPLERAKVAGLTRIAAEFARNGDLFAQKIFYDSGIELAHTVIRGLKLAHSKDNARILISGGLVGCYDLWGASFEETLNKENKGYTPFIGDADMTKGALYYALHNIKKGEN